MTLSRERADQANEALVCAGCATPIPPSRGTKPRKWCSKRCCKRQYDRECVVCGGRVDGTRPSKAPEEPVCGRCAPHHYAVWTPEAIILAIQEYADENDGIPPTAQAWGRLHSRDSTRACSVNNVIRRFGSWNAAVMAAGYEPHAIGQYARRPRLNDFERRELVRRYLAGETSTQLAAAYDVSSMTVLAAVRRHGGCVRTEERVGA